MKDLLRQADEVPVTMVVALAYVTLAILTKSFGMSADPELLDAWGWLTPRDAAGGESWRLLSAAFLHGGLIHLVFKDPLIEVMDCRLRKLFYLDNRFKSFAGKSDFVADLVFADGAWLATFCFYLENMGFG